MLIRLRFLIELAPIPFIGSIAPLTSHLCPRCGRMTNVKQAWPADANVTDHDSGIADCEPLSRNIPRYNRSHSDHRKFSERYSGPDRRIRADGRSLFDETTQGLLSRI